MPYSAQQISGVYLGSKPRLSDGTDEEKMHQNPKGQTVQPLLGGGTEEEEKPFQFLPHYPRRPFSNPCVALGYVGYGCKYICPFSLPSLSIHKSPFEFCSP